MHGPGYRVLYTDGDCEDLTLRELAPPVEREVGPRAGWQVRPRLQAQAPGPGSRPRARATPQGQRPSPRDGACPANHPRPMRSRHKAPPRRRTSPCTSHLAPRTSHLASVLARGAAAAAAVCAWHRAWHVHVPVPVPVRCTACAHGCPTAPRLRATLLRSGVAAAGEEEDGAARQRLPADELPGAGGWAQHVRTPYMHGLCRWDAPPGRQQRGRPPHPSGLVVGPPRRREGRRHSVARGEGQAAQGAWVGGRFATGTSGAGAPLLRRRGAPCAMDNTWRLPCYPAPPPPPPPWPQLLGGLGAGASRGRCKPVRARCSCHPGWRVHAWVPTRRWVSCSQCWWRGGSTGLRMPWPAALLPRLALP